MSFSITGIASGMDTAQMIELMMKLERLPYENLQTRKQELTREQSTIRSINTKLVTLRNAVADLMYSSSFQLTSAKTSDSTVVSVSAGNGASVGSYQIHVDKLAQKHVVASSTEFKKNDSAGALEGQVIKLYGKGDAAGKTIELKGSTYEELLGNLRDEINNAGLGVRAALIETKPGHVTLTLTADKYGTDADMQIGELTDPEDQHTYFDTSSLSVLESLGLVAENDGSYVLNTTQIGRNAVVTVNGLEIQAAGNTLTDVLPGLTITLHKSGDATVTVDTDVDKIADKIQKFVDAYNDVVNTLRTSTAKGADLQGNSTLLSLSMRLSSLFNDQIGGGGEFRFLFEIGLEIDKGVTSGSNMTGTISFDRNKFKEAFAENPEAVKHLFTYDDSGSASQDGVAVRFYNELLNWTRSGNGYLTTMITGYDSTISEITEQMERLDYRLQNRQQQLEAQFAAMENALAQLRSQQTWIAAQIAALTVTSGN
jgi:flagellar hook-associated protein 2